MLPIRGDIGVAGKDPDQQVHPRYQMRQLSHMCKLTPSMLAFREKNIYNRHIRSCQLSRKIPEYKALSKHISAIEINRTG